MVRQTSSDLLGRVGGGETGVVESLPFIQVEGQI